MTEYEFFELELEFIKDVNSEIEGSMSKSSKTVTLIWFNDSFVLVPI